MERWRPLTGVCAVRYKHTTGGSGENIHSEEITVFIYFNIFISNLFQVYLTLSLLSALAACLHNGCHTSHPEEERERARERERGRDRLVFPHAKHSCTWPSVLYSMCACVCVCVYRHQVSPVRYISSPSLNIMLQREHRAQVGW